MGLKGDLTAGEIVEQLLHAQRVTRIKNIVFMVRCLPSMGDCPCRSGALLIGMPYMNETNYAHLWPINLVGKGDH